MSVHVGQKLIGFSLTANVFRNYLFCQSERFDAGIEAIDAAVASNPTSSLATAQDSLTTKTDEEIAQEMLQRELDDTTDASNALKAKLPSQSDMVLAFATVPG